MDDDKLLKELRTQRELIRKHLAWLDQKIGALTGESRKAEVASVDPEVPVEPAEATAESSSSVNDSTAAKSVGSSEDELDRELSRYAPPTGDSVLRAKIGCLVLFVLSTALFLFLLFGLPYLLD